MQSPEPEANDKKLDNNPDVSWPSQRRKERTMPPLSLGYVLKSPLPSSGRLYSVKNS